MNNNIASRPVRTGEKRAQPSSTHSRKGATTIKCGYCHNTFFAVPRDAVCLKCKRAANRPLSWPNKLLSLTAFPIGLLLAILKRPSYPYAASQALLLSIVGALGWAALYFLVLRG